MTMPTIETPRLRLRPFTVDDADAVTAAVSVREVAETTLNVPHPYPAGAARAWIETHAPWFAAGTELTLAVVDRVDGALRGAVSLILTRRFDRSELGYWIARPWWGQGFATEASRALVGHGFEALGLVRVTGQCMTDNRGSSRVMEKVGMVYEGLRRQHIKRDAQYFDVAIYGLLRADGRADG